MNDNDRRNTNEFYAHRALVLERIRKYRAIEDEKRRRKIPSKKRNTNG